MIGQRPRPLSLWAYRAAAGLGAPLARPLLEARARRGKEDPARLGERLGHASAPRPAGPLVWLHAVSVGESLSLLPLIERLAAERPALSFLFTSGTRASAEILAQRLPARVVHQYAPVDTPGAVARFLAHWRPDVGVFAEGELWPNLILSARQSGARLALVSARMTEKASRNWRARPDAIRAMLESFGVILAQDEATEQRLTGFGGKVDGRLNLKRAGDPLPYDAAELARLRAEIGGRRVVVFVSTHAPEEALAARATAPLGPDVLTVVVPRHPQRGAEIANALAPWRTARRSAGEPIEPGTAVYLADTLSEVGLFLRLADVAVMGNSFGADAGGGHNPLEPARLGVGVLSGPAVGSFGDIYPELVAVGAARIVADEADLAAALAALLSDPARLAAMGEAGLAYSARQGGALDAALALLRPLLPTA